MHKFTPADPEFYEGMSPRGISKELKEQYNKAWREGRMNKIGVASLDLCKELHRVSGWKDTQLIYYANAGEHSGTVDDRRMLMEKDANLPAYDSGFLLERLPHFIELVQLSGGYTPNGWRAIKKSSQDYWHKGGPIQVDSDNPTDALCKLAIELFKQGVLKK